MEVVLLTPQTSSDPRLQRRYGTKPSRRAAASPSLLSQAVRRWARHASLRLLAFGNGYKVRLALHWLGIPFAYHEIDILEGRVEDTVLPCEKPIRANPRCWNSTTARAFERAPRSSVYLADGTPLLPDNKLLRTRVLEWMGFEQTQVDGVISRARFRRLYPDAVPTRPGVDAWHRQGCQALRVLDDYFRARTFWSMIASPSPTSRSSPTRIARATVDWK